MYIFSSQSLRPHTDRLKEWFTPWTPKKTLVTVALFGFSLLLLFVILIYRCG